MPPFAEDIKKHKMRHVYVPLVIAFVLTFFGVGLWIASPVLVYSKSTTQAMNVKDMLRCTKTWDTFIATYEKCMYIYMQLNMIYVTLSCMHIIIKITIVSVGMNYCQHQRESESWWDATEAQYT